MRSQRDVLPQYRPSRSPHALAAMVEYVEGTEATGTRAGVGTRRKNGVVRSAELSGATSERTPRSQYSGGRREFGIRV